ncbi:CTP synthetase [Neotabrizicola shimadae]|nr:CTP synthetase [Neotabrizicola shimadae]
MAMTRVMMLLFSMIATTLMGVGIVIALTIGRVDGTAIIAAAVIGFVLAIPASWLVAKQISG